MARTASKFSMTDVDDASAYLEDDVVREALENGVDLRDYAKQVEHELKVVELDAVQDYIKEADNIAVLHHQIRDCDDILQKMELMLGTFQSDLGSISSEIQNLQEQSIQMNIKLKNRQALRGELSQFVDELHVPEKMIEVIVKKSASERDFLEQLHELQHKITFAKEQSFRDAHSYLDVEDILNKLKIKAVEKIREYLMQKISQFRKPLANYQIPQGSMLKNRFYFEFLLANERDIAREIRDEYVDTMSKVFWTYFKTYAGRLLRLQVDEIATKDDLLGIDDTNRSTNFFTLKSTPSKNKAAVFTLAGRNSVITTDLESPLIVTHTSEEKNEKFSFESLFRSMHYALVGNASSEFLFLCDFFMTSGQDADELFHLVLGKSLKILAKTTETYISTSYDCIALLLCSHIVYRYQDMLRKREITVLDNYWTTMVQNIWNRFEAVFIINVDSVRDLDVTKISMPDSRSHFIVRRYAEFASALASINLAWPDDRLNHMLQQLQIEVDNFMHRLAASSSFKDGTSVSQKTGPAVSKQLTEKKRKLIFLMNNYDLVLTTFSQYLSDETTEVIAFKELLQAKTLDYIEELLFTYFGPLVAFIIDCERLIEQGHQESLKRHSDKIPILIKSFGSSWKKNIEQINQEVITSFSSLKQGSNVLQNALTQLIQYYHRFQKVLAHSLFVTCPARNELVNIHHIMVEVKKYKPAF